MKLLALFLALLAPAFARTHYVSTNFSADLLGYPDTRLYTWGYADVQTRTITFTPPAGQHVVLKSIEGSINAFPGASVLPTGDTLPFGSLLFGLQSTGPQGSVFCDLCADNTPLYLQATVSPHVPVNMPFRYKYPGGYELGPDNKLVQVLATFLNVVGVIHVEASYTIGFEFAPASKDAH